MDLKNIENRIINGYRINFEEAVELSNIQDKDALYALADRLRVHFMSNTLDTCSIMNARSGKCSENCKWCSQSAFHKTTADVYPLVSSKEAIDLAKLNFENGVKRFSLVTSGRDMKGEDLKKVCSIYKELSNSVDIYLCASMGLLDYQSMKALKESGVKRYHCNLETSPSYFPKLCTTHTIEDKIETIRHAQSVGMEVCSGGIIGMGESMKDRIEMAITLRELQIRSMPINVLNPIKGTPLENTKPLSDEELLTSFALFKIINPESRVRFAGGRTLFAHIQEKALRSGVDAAMIGDLLTTIGADTISDKMLFEKMGFDLENKSNL